MNLKSLSVASMIMVTEQWTTGKGRTVIDGLALCRALLGKLEEVHQGILTIQPQRSGLTEAIKAARAAVSLADDTFDMRGRGLFRGLQALESLSEDPATAALFSAARDAIFPNGLSVLNLPFLQEVGEARLAKQRMKPELRATLDQTQLGPFTVGEAFDRWLAAADDLNAKLQARDAAEAALAGAADTISPAAAHEAKLSWVRAVSAFLGNLELEAIDTDTRDALLKTLRGEVARGATQAAKSASGEADLDAAPPADAAN